MEEPKEVKFIFRMIDEKKNLMGSLDHSIAFAEGKPQIEDLESPVKSLDSFLQHMMSNLAEYCKTKKVKIENADKLRRIIAVELICLDVYKPNEITIDVLVSKEESRDG